VIYESRFEIPSFTHNYFVNQSEKWIDYRFCQLNRFRRCRPKFNYLLQ
jgi:hypothetical protein